MSKRLLWLLSSTVIFWMVVALGGSLKWGQDAVLLSSVAVLLCLAPTVFTLWWAEWARRQAPEQQLVAVLGGTGIRMAVVLGAGLTLTLSVPYFGEDHLFAFWGWLLLSYLVTLALEVLLLLTDRAPTAATPSSPERQAP